MSANATKKEKKKSLKGRMSCDKHDCDRGLHCFILTKKMSREIKPKPNGSCQFCGAQNIVDWEFVRQRDPNRIEETIVALKNEGVRHEFWCVVELSTEAIIHARKKGRIKMREAVEKRIMQSVGKAQNWREGYQTPWEGKLATCYAQHATATCCRPCIEHWHGIEQGRDLTKEEVEYLSSLVCRYIEEKIVLTENGEKAKDIIKHLRSAPLKQGKKRKGNVN
jgi:hypothetical protein